MIVNSDKCREIDHYAIKVLEIPSILLMENAALKVLKHIDTVRFSKIAICCGPGNNGADGLAIARHLVNLEVDLRVYIIGDINENNKDFMTYYKILNNLKVDLRTIETIEDIENFEEDISKYELIVDAIFGTGLERPVKGVFEYIIDMINHSKRKIISVDVPSGLNTQNGTRIGSVIDPDICVTFQYRKPGMKEENFSSIIVEPISLPREAIKKILG